ncbi:RNA polymerase sigma factor [Tunicatimonas pelagia]|uniref:RNA polymerase sigma factor n=1 Tax=Tunicatimonas pelagia TaxID=931531 RepID=UPI00266561D6|nr:RNA polymerase sigma-70 factor [Tunicatimonas pelagia]WKN46276.1 RNA polymerase sigma-70 factor [Tunicatimonas pelagia]
MVSSEIMLYQRLAKGDTKAFTKIYQQYWEQLYASALHLTSDEAVAEEITQDIFTELWQKRSDLRIRTSLRSYLFGILKHKVYNHWDAQAVRYRYRKRILPAEPCYTTEEEVAYHETSDLLEEALATLPQKSRSIFLLSRRENQSLKEIASHMNLSTKAVEYHITKALRHLRFHLREVLFVMLGCFLS